MSANQKKAGRWERQLKEVCSMLGFSVDERWDCDGRIHYSRVRLKCGRAHVMRVDRSCAWRSCSEAAVMSSVAIDASKNYEGACRDVMRQLSSSELIVRATEPQRRSRWGFTRVRTERHIRLPEFSSAAELSLKLEVSE